MLENPNDPITIQPARPDAPEAVALINELEATLAPLYPGASMHGYSVEKLIAQKVAFFILRVDGQPAGCGGVQFYGKDYGEVKRIFVRPQFRGRGLSKRMMAFLEEYTRAAGIPSCGWRRASISPRPSACTSAWATAASARSGNIRMIR